MWRSMLNVMMATAAFGVVHSAFASRGAKRAASRSFGERNRNGLYRLFYLAQSGATLGLLVAYIRRQPSRGLYRVEGMPAALMRTAQLGSLLYATSAARQIGIGRILGWENFVRWLSAGETGPEPEGQGPALDRQGQERSAGPFAWSRHPLNFAPLPILWLWPRMTTNLLAFNIAGTVYLVLGSLHEEIRLREVYGDDYAAYQQSGIAFYWPRPSRSAVKPLNALAGLDASNSSTGMAVAVAPANASRHDGRRIDAL